MGSARFANLRRLWKGAYRGGRKSGKVKLLPLQPATLGKDAPPPPHRFRYRGKASFHKRIMNLWRRGPRGGGLSRCLQFVGNSVPAFRQRARQHPELIHLLHRKGEPRFKLSVEGGFQFEVDR